MANRSLSKANSGVIGTAITFGERKNISLVVNRSSVNRTWNWEVVMAPFSARMKTLAYAGRAGVSGTHGKRMNQTFGRTNQHKNNSRAGKLFKQNQRQKAFLVQKQILTPKGGNCRRECHIRFHAIRVEATSRERGRNSSLKARALKVSILQKH